MKLVEAVERVIRSQLTLRGMKVADFAVQIGVSRQAASQGIGRVRRSMPAFIVACDRLGLKPSDVLRDAENLVKPEKIPNGDG